MMIIKLGDDHPSLSLLSTLLSDPVTSIAREEKGVIFLSLNVVRESRIRSDFSPHHEK